MIHGAVSVLYADAGGEPVAPCDLEAWDDGDRHAHDAARDVFVFVFGFGEEIRDAFGGDGGGEGFFCWRGWGCGGWGCGGNVFDYLLAEGVVLVYEAEVGLE